MPRDRGAGRGRTQSEGLRRDQRSSRNSAGLSNEPSRRECPTPRAGRGIVPAGMPTDPPAPCRAVRPGWPATGSVGRGGAPPRRRRRRASGPRVRGASACGSWRSDTGAGSQEVRNRHVAGEEHEDDLARQVLEQQPQAGDRRGRARWSGRRRAAPRIRSSSAASTCAAAGRSSARRRQPPHGRR